MEKCCKTLFCKYCFIPAITATFRRSVFEKTGPLWGAGAICDYLKWIEITLISDGYYISDPLGYWRRHPRSLSLTADTERTYLAQIEGLKELTRKHKELKEIVGKCEKRRYARMYFLIGFFSALGEDYAKATKYFLKSVRTFPFAPENWIGFLLSLCPYRAIPSNVFELVYKKVYKWQ